MKSYFRAIAKWLGILLFAGLGMFILLTLWYIKDLPNPEAMIAKGFAQSTKIYDRTGKVLLYQVGQERRTYVPLDQVSNNVRFAILAAEDADFYKHPGVNVLGIIRAAWKDLLNQRLEQGGSTITQQFVKNALLSSEKTFSRKFKEIILSFWLEFRYTKDQIFTFYINQIPYGSNAYGVQQASVTFFAKPASDLDIAQAAALATLAQRPSYYSPYGDHVGELMTRKNAIIDGMVKAGSITGAQARQAKEEKLSFSQPNNSFLAPHFVIYVKDYLEEKYGSGLLEKGGLQVITSLDLRLQKQAEESVAQVVQKNEKQYRASNASLVALDPKTGQILSMVGSRDWFDDAHDGKVNVALRLRQPGSSFKPFAYARLFEDGFGPDSLIFDLQTTFKTRAGQTYTPRNFNGKFNGLLSMRQALGGSRNVPAVKTLYLAGINNVIELAKKMGINTINPGRVDLALVLGGAEVRLLDLTSAYSVFANEGVKNDPVSILRVTSSKGEILEEYKAAGQPVLAPEITRLITSILSDNGARSYVFGPSSPLVVPGVQTAVKTGTTTDFRDGWTIGYTPNLAVGVWAGNNDNSQTRNGEGAYIAGPIWNRLIKFAASKYPEEFGGSFPPLLPHQLLDKPMVNGKLALEKHVLIDITTGEPATDYTPADVTKDQVTREIHSLLYYVRPNDPQLPAWEAPIKAWVASQPDAASYNQVPSGSSPSPQPQPSQAPELTITSPADNQQVGSSLPIIFSFTSASALKQVDIFVDDALVKTAFSSPTDIDLSSFLPGNHTLHLRAFDQSLKYGEQAITIQLQ